MIQGPMAGFSFISLRWWWLCLAATGPWLIAQGQTTWDSLAVQNMDHLGESALWPSLLDPKSPFHSSIKPWNAQHMPQELRGYRAMDSG
ncbi:MAG: hypothetical protein ACKO9W_13775, partial [Bacteroidota bacterium]